MRGHVLIEDLRQSSTADDIPVLVNSKPTCPSAAGKVSIMCLINLTSEQAWSAGRQRFVAPGV